jgi:uncharacterized membrane protein
MKEFALGFLARLGAWILFTALMLVIGLVISIPLIALEVGLSLMHINPDIVFGTLLLAWLLYNCYSDTIKDIKHKRGK